MGTIQIDGSTPKITVGNATAEDATILFDGNAQDFYIALDDSADDLVIGLGSTVGTTPAISINEDQDVTISDGAIDFDVASHDGTNGLKLGGTLVTTTAAEMNLIDGGTARGTTALADGDGILINDGGTMRMTNVTTVKTYMGETNTSFQVKHVAGQTITNVTTTKVLFDTVKFDTASGYDTTNDRYVIQTGDDGKWLFWFKGAYRTDTDSDNPTIKIYKNGSCIDEHRYINQYYQSYAGVFALDLAATDYVEIFVYHSFGGDTTLSGGDDNNASSFGGMLMEA